MTKKYKRGNEEKVASDTFINCCIITIISCLLVGIILLIVVKSDAKEDYTQYIKEPINTIEECMDSVTTYYNVPLSCEMQDYIRTTCNKYDVEMELVLAVIKQESNFNPNLISNTNDYGYMQINKTNHQWLSGKFDVCDFLQPQDNILCGIYMLHNALVTTEGNVPMALMVYNCGKAGASKLWESGIYSTQYTDTVISSYYDYKENYE